MQMHVERDETMLRSQPSMFLRDQSMKASRGEGSLRREIDEMTRGIGLGDARLWLHSRRILKCANLTLIILIASQNIPTTAHMLIPLVPLDRNGGHCCTWLDCFDTVLFDASVSRFIPTFSLTPAANTWISVIQEAVGRKADGTPLRHLACVSALNWMWGRQKGRTSSIADNHKKLVAEWFEETPIEAQLIFQQRMEPQQ